MAAASRYGIARPFWDALAMCADPAIDIVDIGTRPSVRHPMVLAAMANGKHVYNGIPMARDYAAAGELHEAWKAAGTVAVVDAFSQWIPQFRATKDLLDEGFIGKPFGGNARFTMSLFNRPDPDFAYNWFWQRGLGVSAVRNLGSHMLHMLVHLLGPIDAVAADESRLLDEWLFPDGTMLSPETYDFANLTLRFASGLVMPVQISWNAPVAEGWALDIWGADGRIVSSAPGFPSSRTTSLAAGRTGGQLRAIEVPERLKAASGLAIDSGHPVSPAYPMALAMKSMVDAIRDGSPVAPDFAQGFEVERVQEAIRRASLEQRWIEVSAVK